MNWWRKKKTDKAGKSYIPLEVKTIDEDIEPGLNVNSATWKFIKFYAESKLQQVRELNDSRTVDATRTAFLRGNIEVYKDILKLPESILDKQRAGLLDRHSLPVGRV